MNLKLKINCKNSSVIEKLGLNLSASEEPQVLPQDVFIAQDILAQETQEIQTPAKKSSTRDEFTTEMAKAEYGC